MCAWYDVCRGGDQGRGDDAPGWDGEEHDEGVQCAHRRIGDADTEDRTA